MVKRLIVVYGYYEKKKKKKKKKKQLDQINSSCINWIKSIAVV